MCELGQLIEVCERAARAGGSVLLDWAGRVTIREKSPADLVTEADIAAQEAVRQTIATAFPNHRFVGEETAETAAPASMDALLADGTSYLWIVDPLDGTTNYAHNVPHYACSVAAVRGGEVFAAAVYNPTGDECFTAVHGGGALLNGAPIHVSRIEKLARALVAASFPPHLSRDGPEIDNLLRVLERAQAIRRTGSAALNMCYVAAGRLDGYWATGTHAWDIAAGILLVREAGGVVTALGGGRFQLSRPQPVATGTKSLNAELSALLASDGQGGDRSAQESREAAPGA